MRLIQTPGDRPDLAVRLAGGEPGADGRRPVLLVHGMGSDHTTWRSVARALRVQGRAVIAVDLRGHGRSGHALHYRLDDFRDDLAHVLDALGVDETDVVAHSLGAHTALRLAMAQPERIARLVLEEPPPMPGTDDDLAEQIVPRSSSLREKARTVRAVAVRPRPFLSFDRLVPASVLLQFRQVDRRWWEGLPAVQAPVLVVSGGERSFLPPRHLHRLAAALPDAEFTTIDSGHNVHRDSPTDFLAAALAHLDDAPTVQ